MLEIRKASAGSGKTFQLARKYVLNVLSTTDKSGNLTLNPDPTEAHRRILAITFTNKATAEMKARIISEIARLAYVNDGSFVKSDHRNYLCNELNCSPAELQQAASKALSSILFSYHYFNVSTIDSFFQLVLRNFAREVD
ncbi:MAG: UvrD-helicase domain-containing protein, partial [Muribaculaceae bacterium]|nr:UvrD-helicase domain-containing protein [Muribaculaceae bacterium]